MIVIRNQPWDEATLLNEFPTNSIERKIIKILASGVTTYKYDSINQLKFELRLRNEIIKASNDLLNSGMHFYVFRDSICNPDYWQRANDGGFNLKPGVRPSDAVRDIFNNGSLYGTECATAMLIVYYKALLEIFPEDAYNRIFSDIHLMNWHRIEKELREVGLMLSAKDFLPGDRRYFNNPDVEPLKPEWQGENVIDMGNSLYYGHGIGKYTADVFIDALNRKRKEGADQSAYLMDTVGRPNFKRLSDLYDKTTLDLSTSLSSPDAAAL